MFKENNFNDLYKVLIDYVLTNGSKVNPRGLPCLEVCPGVFELTDISRSLLTLKERKLSYKFNAVEKLCYISGNGGESVLTKYSKNIGNFINPITKKFDGAYGPRLIKQYQWILNLLKKDPDTRQALLTINNYHEDQHESLDVPCTCLLQFLIREGKLNLIVYMRSNDLFWGTPYDCSQFTFIQECFANILNVELGTYTHIAGSLHIYEKDIEKFKKILYSSEINDQVQQRVDICSYKQLQDQTRMVLDNSVDDNQFDFNSNLTPYFKYLYNILNA